MKLDKVLLIAILWLCGSANAQMENRILQVGDKAPSIKAFKWIKGTPVTEFRKGQVYLVEFGATWCTPCAALIPHLTALSKKYENKINVVSFFVMEKNDEPAKTKNPVYVAKVDQYVKLKGDKMMYSVGVDDPAGTMEFNWLKKAGKDGVPYSFVIDKNGYIAWIGTGELLEPVIETVISDSYDLAKAVKWDREQQTRVTPYDPTKLLLIKGNGGEDTDFEYRSLITKYKGDFQAAPNMFVNSYRWAKPGSREEKYQGTIQEIGRPLSYLYYMAYADTVINWCLPAKGPGSNWLSSYGVYWSEPILEVKDKNPFLYSSGLPQNKYNYSLKVPVEKASAKFLQEAMQRDMKTYFGYDVTVEIRMMPCWKLKATEQARDMLKSKTPGAKIKEVDFSVEKGVSMTNGNIHAIVFVLHGYALDQKEVVIDETGITDEIDFKIEANLKDFEDFKRGLEKIGLNLEKGEKEMKVVVIRDAKN